MPEIGQLDYQKQIIICDLLDDFLKKIFKCMYFVIADKII